MGGGGAQCFLCAGTGKRWVATRNVYGDEAAAEVAAFDPTIVMHHEGGWQVVVDQAAGAASEVAKACTVCGDPASSSPDCLGCTGAAGAARAGAVGAVGAVEAKNGAAVGALENPGEEGGDPTTKAECTRMIEVARKAKKKREVRRREKREKREENVSSSIYIMDDTAPSVILCHSVRIVVGPTCVGVQDEDVRHR